MKQLDKAMASSPAPVWLLIFVLVFVSCAVFAGTGPEMKQATSDSGGGRIDAGVLVLISSIGQPDAGISTGGSLSLQSGFWAGTSDSIFKHGFED